MQLAIATDHVDRIDLVLAAWSQAAPADAPTNGRTPVDRPGAEEAAGEQLVLRLADEQLPIWEARAAR